MKWTWILCGAVVLVAVWSVRAATGLSNDKTRELLKNGALVIDVRTVEEYNAWHLPKAVNLPLAQLKDKIAQTVPDKGRVLLLHCQSGMRSAAAERQLRSLGYTNAFNIGSLAQAKKIVGEVSK